MAHAKDSVLIAPRPVGRHIIIVSLAAMAIGCLTYNTANLDR